MTAAGLAAELEVSTRSVYRDVASLVRQGVPIHGEEGVGYILDRHYDMPPLMLTPAELEAAVLGAQWVAEKADPALADAARDLISKISSAVPQHLRTFIIQPTGGIPVNNVPITDGLDMAKTREWIRGGYKLRIYYRDQEGKPSERVTSGPSWSDTLKVCACLRRGANPGRHSGTSERTASRVRNF